jgi:DNA-binding XRE family transcriptional regulator
MENKMTNNSDINIDVNLLKKLREIEGHTQDSLATALRLSTRQIKRIEKEGNTSLKTAKLLCNEFRIDIDQLIGKKAIGRVLPHYWCNVSTLDFIGCENKDTCKKSGYVFDHTLDLVSFIASNIDECFPETILPPCNSQAQVTSQLSQDEDKWILQVESTQEEREILRIEFIPFRFTEKGMEWTGYCPVDNKWLQRELISGLTDHVTDYITPEFSKIIDPLYCASIYLELLPIERTKFDMQQQSDVDSEQQSNETNVLDLFNSDHRIMEKLQKYIRDNQAGNIAQFWFEQEEDLIGFIHTLIMSYCPERIETELGQVRFVPSGGFNPDCRPFTINFTRNAKGKNRQLPWPKKHKKIIQQRFDEYNNLLDNEKSSTHLTIEQLNEIYKMYGNINH